MRRPGPSSDLKDNYVCDVLLLGVVVLEEGDYGQIGALMCGNTM